jgi:hypothetical protein
MSSEPASPRDRRHRLWLVEAPTGNRYSQGRSTRRKGGPSRFGTPIARGVLALVGAVVTGGLGAVFFASGMKAPALGFAGMAIAFMALYGGLVAQAIKRGKVVGYWEDRRDLRRALGRQEAYSRLLAATLDEVRRLEDRRNDAMTVNRSLQALVNATYSVLAPAHDDLAVLLAYQAGENCEVIRSKLSPGSRWHELRKGKRCDFKGNFEQRLEELDPHHHSEEIATYFEPMGVFPLEAPTSWQGRLWLVLLQDKDLTEQEVALIKPLRSHFSLVADHWEPGFLTPEPGSLHAVGS